MRVVVCLLFCLMLVFSASAEKTITKKVEGNVTIYEVTETKVTERFTMEELETTLARLEAGIQRLKDLKVEAKKVE